MFTIIALLLMFLFFVILWYGFYILSIKIIDTEKEAIVLVVLIGAILLAFNIFSMAHFPKWINLFSAAQQ
jgi:hypothetical protein